MAAAAHHALGEDLAAEVVLVLAEDLHPDDAAVDQDDVADVDVVDEVVVIDVDRIFLVALGAAHGEGEVVPGLQVELVGQVAGADLGSLGVEHQADMDARFLADLADPLADGAHPVVLGVRHVEAEDIDPVVHELTEAVGRFADGAEGGDDFGAAHKIKRV